ncbi:MAG TPA: ribulose-phosphate 3-epimerase [Firmicutes bacterium]|nr:ribulose-phosphate 3-epimerase [Bacillota bacterium]
MPEIKVAPSILAGDFARMGETVKKLEECGADYVHCDVMDGNFVPTITFGSQMIGAIRPYTGLPLDCHLMVLRPDTRLEALARAGADIVTVHVEECRELTVQTLRIIKNYGMKASAVINPNTPVEELFDCAEDADMLLLMSVHPGWGGQKFLPGTLEKIEKLREFLIRSGRPDLDIEVDGGITEQNVRDVISAGANVIVAGSAVFRSPDMKQTIERLRGA